MQNPYAADGTANDRVRFAEAEMKAKEEEGVLGFWTLGRYWNL
jgi:hypothetical protein